MANALGRLLGRRDPRGTSEDVPSDDGPPVDIDALPLEGILDEPPALVPAAIYRQPLFAPSELTPAWLRPRPSAPPDPARSSGTTVNEGVVEGVVTETASTAELKPTKRTRRPKASDSSGTSRPKPKRGAKTDHEATDRS